MKAEFVNDAKWVSFYGKTIKEALEKISDFLSMPELEDPEMSEGIQIELKYDDIQWRAGCFVFNQDVEEE